MKSIIFASLVLFIGTACNPGAVRGTSAPEYMIYLNDNDSLRCSIVRGEILVTTVLTADGDSLELQNESIDRIVLLRTNRDVTGRFIDRDALKIELAKRDALVKRAKLRQDIIAGKKKKSELDRVPFAVLSASMENEGKKTPEVLLTILNLTDKKITLVKTRVYCYDGKGRPISGTKGRNHIFDASSRIPIGPGEDFTTTLALRNHPGTRKAKVEIHYLEYSDKTWWKGKVEESAD